MVQATGGTINAKAPHFVLFSEASRPDANDSQETASGWRFVLQSATGEGQFVASDVEPDTRGERLELLAVVRGLEALDQPSRVTLMTRSRYVSRGLRGGLEAWREAGWQWERFGRLVPVKNRDLWQRVDRALRFHTVECRRWRVDGPHMRCDRGTAPSRREGPAAVRQPRFLAHPSRRAGPGSTHPGRPGDTWTRRFRTAWRAMVVSPRRWRVARQAADTSGC